MPYLRNNLKTILMLMVLFLAVALLVFVSLFVNKRFDPVSNTVSNTVVNNKADIPKTNNQKDSVEESFASIQFYIKDASLEYLDLHEGLSEIFSQVSVNTSINTSELRKKFLVESLKFYFDENKNKQERAYSLNMFTLVFLQEPNNEMFYEVIKIYPSLLNEYGKNLGEVNKLKSNNKNISGIMFNNGSVNKNYAMQKTHSYINSLSYSVYPNSYALLRQSLNQSQANYLLFLNFELDKKYSPGQFISESKYYKGYIDYYDEKINNHIRKGDLYKDLFASSYEVDIMYSEFLFIKYFDLLSKDKKDEAKNVLKKIDLLTASMINNSNRYNAENLLFYGYAAASMNKVRIAKLKVFNVQENENLLKSGEEIFLKLIRENKNPQFNFWIKNMSKQISTYKAIETLGTRNSEIKKFLDNL